MLCFRYIKNICWHSITKSFASASPAMLDIIFMIDRIRIYCVVYCTDLLDESYLSAL